MDFPPAQAAAAPAPSAYPARGLSAGAKVAIGIGIVLGVGVFWLAAVIVLAPLRLLPVSRQRLPGFELAVPPGHRELDGKQYPSGDLLIQAWMGFGAVRVSWEPGGLTSKKEVGEIVEAE